jgi:hypothetical protein
MPARVGIRFRRSLTMGGALRKKDTPRALSASPRLLGPFPGLSILFPCEPPKGKPPQVDGPPGGGLILS